MKKVPIAAFLGVLTLGLAHASVIQTNAVSMSNLPAATTTDNDDGNTAFSSATGFSFGAPINMTPPTGAIMVLPVDFDNDSDVDGVAYIFPAQSDKDDEGQTVTTGGQTSTSGGDDGDPASTGGQGQGSMNSGGSAVGSASGNGPTSAVPEPATLTLLGMGLISLSLSHRKLSRK